MIPDETVAQILDTARIEEVVGDFLTLKRRGGSYVACCPFHNEKTPSFHVNPSRGIYKCFGCGKAGSAVGFVMEYEHMSYPEALRYLAAKYHIEILEKDENPEDIARRQRRESLIVASDFAQKFFVDALNSDEGRAYGQAYCRSRGLEPETVSRFGIGWAPRSRTALVDAARAAGHNLDYLVDIGLVIKKDDGSLVDRFSERLMFPIHSLTGHVIAYSGRTLRADYKDLNIGKYVNSPETELYVKSRSLYGIYMAKGEISKADKCYLLEGNIDVVTMSQLGIRNVVASCGTALTEEQIRTIHKFTSNVTIMYDGDAAGIHAAMRAIDMMLAEGISVRVILFPDGDDPDSFARKHTLEEVREFIERNEQDFVTYKAEMLLRDAQNDPLKRASAINEIADSVARITDPVTRSVYQSSVAARFDLSDDVLRQRVNSTRNMMMEQERTEQERRRRRETAGLDPDGPQDAAAPAREKSEVEVTMEALEVVKSVAQTEKELLNFLLKYGTDVLEFPVDSEYYAGEDDKLTVTDFISEVIEGDGGHLLNPAFDKVYLSYLALYDEGLQTEDIIRRMAASPDSEISFVTAQLSLDKYELTVKDFSASMTNVSTWLVEYVPRTILQYNSKKIEYQLSLVIDEMKSAPAERQAELMNQMVGLQKASRIIKKKLKETKHI